MTDTEPAPMEPEPMEPEAMEPEAMEPEVADDKKPTATRAPVAKKPEGESGGGPDILQQLQTAQLQRIQLAVDFLTTPTVRPQPNEKKNEYLREQLKLSSVELEKAVDQAKDLLLKPAVEFLLNPQVTDQNVTRKVEFLQTKLFLNDEDLEEAFKKIGDEAGPKYFSKKRVSTGVKFLTNPQLASKPVDAKIKYLKDKMKLSQDEVSQAFRMKDNMERAAKAKAAAATTTAETGQDRTDSAASNSTESESSPKSSE